MQALEEAFVAAVSAGKIPGAVLVASNRSGNFSYAKAFGARSLAEGKEEPLEMDSIFALFSSSKLITTIAVLQVLERGQIGLDDDVTSILPELAGNHILIGMENGKPVFTKRQNPITLRHLLTHSSGLAYTFMSPVLQEYHASLGVAGPPKNVVESYNLPLVFEPGTSWKYSTGLDWAGVLVSRVANVDLETYCQNNIFAPLGISDITFWAKKKPELAARLVSMSIRDPADPNGKARAYLGPDMHSAAQTEMGGQGLYASMPSYLRILHSILVDDEKLLKKETTAMMFQPQLSKDSRSALQALYDSRPTRGPCAIGRFPPGVRYDWGLGGLLTREDVNLEGVTYRRAGCLNWSGMPNLFWFLDRAAGVCGIYGGQLMPSGDAQVQEMIYLFEKTVYEQAGVKSND
ncbi:beta-lactamase [Cladophialophora psammophila CBS 110553]|uniref:Beta-lactamase n=1 Tax=Cladophialophora psammophila CBS 110553 TaxID=1182543 RepID=W9VQB0_9EURO|nr:beta-lactamase [Cladophialophora psammophila CBS 110553]EXJ57743.1 beta-lactamase [Cladophialophora psammophila CBS 110553]